MHPDRPAWPRSRPLQRRLVDDDPRLTATIPEARVQAAAERATIDASCRGPVLSFAASGVFWLLVGSLLALIASIKLHSPYFLTGSPELTFGRVRMAHLQAVGIGWSSMATVAASLWLMCRLSRAELLYPELLYVSPARCGTSAWSLAVAGILFGDAQSVEWLDAPQYAPPFFVAGLGLVSAWVVAVFRRRREPHVYVTQWYILAAVFWFPWIYLVAIFMIFWSPATGVVQPIVNWWFGHNVLGLWFTPVAVGAAYYLIPKIIGRPIHSYYLSIIGFWSLALFYSWAGMHHLIGGPIPAWLATASTVGSMMMFIPVIAVAINHHMTMLGHFHRLKYSPALRFTVFGAIAYTAVSFQGSIEALKDFSEVAHFTHYTVAHAHLGAYGFVTMIYVRPVLLHGPAADRPRVGQQPADPRALLVRGRRHHALLRQPLDRRVVAGADAEQPERAVREHRPLPAAVLDAPQSSRACC